MNSQKSKGMIENEKSQYKNVDLQMIFNNQQTIINQISNLQTTLNNFTESFTGYANKESTSSNQTFQLECIIEPINTLEKLNDFEEKLKNKDYMDKVIESMIFVCGKSGKAIGIDCCYKLIDYFLSRDFVTQCSWTGNTRIEGNSKVPLKFFENFRKCFLKLIMIADKDFTESECDLFFKRIMRNSLKRKVQKIMSKHKNRPKCLKYTTKTSTIAKSTLQMSDNKELDPLDMETDDEFDA